MNRLRRYTGQRVLEPIRIKGAYGFIVVRADHDANYPTLSRHAHGLALGVVDKLPETGFDLCGGEDFIADS